MYYQSLENAISKTDVYIKFDTNDYNTTDITNLELKLILLEFQNE